MAVRKLRLRTVHLAGRPFTWQAEIIAVAGPDGYRRRAVRVRVWGAGKTGAALQFEFLDPAGSVPGTGYPTAAEIRERVTAGLAAGWIADRPGPAFPLPPVEWPIRGGRGGSTGRA